MHHAVYRCVGAAAHRHTGHALAGSVDRYACARKSRCAAAPASGRGPVCAVGMHTMPRSFTRFTVHVGGSRGVLFPGRSPPPGTWCRPVEGGGGLAVSLKVTKLSDPASGVTGTVAHGDPASNGAPVYSPPLCCLGGGGMYVGRGGIDAMLHRMRRAERVWGRRVRFLWAR